MRDGNKLLTDYNGSKSSTVDINEIISNSSLSYINHLMRLSENIYIALEIAGLNQIGFDGMIGAIIDEEKKKIDLTEVNTTLVVQGDDSVDVDTTQGLEAGLNYILTDGNNSEEVKIKEVKKDINRVILSDVVKQEFNENAKLCRSTDNVYVTKKTILANKVTRVHLTVKHKTNTKEDIESEIAIRTATTGETFSPMVKGKTYADISNSNRCSTQFTYITESDDLAGDVVTVRIKGDGVDSFAGICNE